MKNVTLCDCCSKTCKKSLMECSEFFRACNCGSGQPCDMCSVGSDYCG